MKPVVAAPSTFAIYVCLAASLAPAAVVNLDWVIDPAAVTSARQVIDDESPLPGRTYVDTLSFAAGPASFAGGDTVHYRVMLRDPARFEISPEAAKEFIGGFYGRLDLNAAFVTGLTSPTPLNRPVPPGTVTLDATQNVAQGTADTSGDYASDRQSGDTIHVTQSGTVMAHLVPADADQPARFAGFEGTFDAPALMPATNFPDVSFSIAASTRADTAPPPLVYVTPVPEPAAGFLVASAGLALLRRRGR